MGISRKGSFFYDCGGCYKVVYYNELTGKYRDTICGMGYKKGFIIEEEM